MFNVNDYTIIELIFISLFIFRISLMLSSEDGFLSFAFALRLFGSKIHSGKEPISKITAWKTSLKRGGDAFILIPSNHFGQLISCIWCTSVWVSFLTLPLYEFLKDTPFIFIFYALGFSAISVIINRHLGD